MAAEPEVSNRSLLLLSLPDASLPRAALHEAYKETINAAVAAVPPFSQLHVAVAGPFIPINWSSLQSLLASLYSLSTLIQATSSSEDASITFILIDHVSGQPCSIGEGSPANGTSIPDLGRFASKHHGFTMMLHSNSKPHQELQNAYLALVEKYQFPRPAHIVSIATEGQQVAVPGNRENETETNTELRGNVVLAGTFDHFHAGHKLLVNAATLLLKIPSSQYTSSQSILTIGVTGDELLQNKKYASEIEPWKARAMSVIEFISTILCTSCECSKTREYGDFEELRATVCEGRLLIRCVRIIDVYGPTITEEDIEAIVVSAETRTGGGTVNAQRAKQGWRELELYEISVLNGQGVEEGRASVEDFSNKISSTELRRREHNKRGIE